MTTTPDAGRQVVERLGLWDTPPEERFDRITRAAQETFGVDFALVNIVGDGDVYTKSQPAGPRLGFSSAADVFCAETIRQDGILEIDDAAADARFRDRAAVTHYGMRFYAGYPLRTEDGEAVATLCLLDGEPRELSADERRALERLGRWAQAEIRHTDGVATAAARYVSPREDVLDEGEVRLAALAIPHGAVSGDRSGWQRFGGRVVVTLADVMGKGDAAGRLADGLLAALQARRDLSPVDAIGAVETDLGVPEYGDTFATLFHAVVDTAAGVVDFVDAGHGLTLLLRRDGSSERLSSHNLPFGLRPPGVDWEPGRIEVGRGDLIVTVSDGALDAYDSTLDSLRLIGADLRGAGTADVFFRELTVRVSAHAVDDDVTAVVIGLH